MKYSNEMLVLADLFEERGEDPKAHALRLAADDTNVLGYSPLWPLIYDWPWHDDYDTFVEFGHEVYKEFIDRFAATLAWGDADAFILRLRYTLENVHGRRDDEELEDNYNHMLAGLPSHVPSYPYYVLRYYVELLRNPWLDGDSKLPVKQDGAWYLCCGAASIEGERLETDLMKRFGWIIEIWLKLIWKGINAWV